MFGLLLMNAALASPGYPGDIEGDLGMPCVPTCTLCHEDNAGGSDTVTQEVGLALEDRGLTGGSASDLLLTALDALGADAVDSDGDGTLDVDELVEGNDPNPGGVAFCDVLQPTYGCFNTAQAPASLLLVIGALFAAAGMRRR